MCDSEDTLNVAKKLVECGYALNTRSVNDRLTTSRKVS